MGPSTSLDRFEWTDTGIAQLRTLVGLGLSGGQIANALGCTRNAVIGKMHRNGIKSTKTKGHQPGEPAPWKAAKPKPAPRPNMMAINAKAARRAPFIAPRPPIEQPVQAPSTPPPTAKAFEELAHGECRWPYGDGTPYLFCGATQAKDKPYCGPHCAIAYQPTARLTKLREVGA